MSVSNFCYQINSINFLEIVNTLATLFFALIGCNFSLTEKKEKVRKEIKEYYFSKIEKFNLLKQNIIVIKEYIEKFLLNHKEKDTDFYRKVFISIIDLFIERINNNFKIKQVIENEIIIEFSKKYSNYDIFFDKILSYDGYEWKFEQKIKDLKNNLEEILKNRNISNYIKEFNLYCSEIEKLEKEYNYSIENFNKNIELFIKSKINFKNFLFLC